MMSGIKGKNTKPELIVRRFLHGEGLRFRLHGRKLPGRPDLVFPRHRAAVLVHGCFWHQHKGCQYAYMPATNTKFWREKLEGNAARDQRSESALRNLGWRVFTVWECEVGDTAALNRLAWAIRQREA